jgi:hypothetical protein
MSDAPKEPVGDGRGSDGRFKPGNKAAKGNPHAKAVQKLRAALFEAVQPDDLRQIVAAMVEKAKAGDIPACREVLERTLGKPEAADFVARLEALEERIAELQKRGQQA